MKKLAGLVLVAAVFTGVGLLVGIAAAESEESVGGEAEEVASPSPESSTEIEVEKAPEVMTEAELWKKDSRSNATSNKIFVSINTFFIYTFL